MSETIYYKATRPDGTAFRTGTVRYEVGATISHPTSARFGDMKPNDPGTYLSVSVEPGEVLVGGSWPCRLFRVEPIGKTVKRTDGKWPYKRGCRALRVVEELPAHVAFGPNGEQVAAIIERAGRLTADEARRLSAAGAALGAAWDYALGAAGGAARGAARGAAWDATWDATGDATAWDYAWGAAMDAARGALVRDLITPEQFDVLYGPWASVIGGE